jgi:hypothetical protein
MTARARTVEAPEAEKQRAARQFIHLNICVRTFITFLGRAQPGAQATYGDGYERPSETTSNAHKT